MKSSFSSWPQHENFEELAALAAVGELSALELERLRHHLAECSRCRDAYEAFADVASNDLGVAVAARESIEDVGQPDADQTQAREHLERLRDRLKAEDSKLVYARESPKGVPTSGVANERRIRAAAAYGIAAVLLLSVVVAGGIAFWRSAKIASAERAHSRELQVVLDSLKQQTRDDRAGSSNAVLRSLEESQRIRDALQRSLAASQAKNEELLAGERASEEKLAGAIGTAEQLRQQLAMNDGDRQRLTKLQQESDAKLHEALVELYQARQANAQVAAKGDAPGDASLEANGQPSPETGPVPASPSEIEARNLFGARDLHIVDVYDVKGDGKTKRTYGRVYYVEKRLLVFYAFDLQNRQNHKRAVFQAWGYREANVGKPLNLGLFAIDDSAVSRWVLKVNRADVLSHIDAVFVTVEPPGGSKDPRGKKVLYANLVGPPNHP
jgi:hypothetical protein